MGCFRCFCSPPSLPVILTKGNNFSDFLFASLYDVALIGEQSHFFESCGHREGRKNEICGVDFPEGVPNRLKAKRYTFRGSNSDICIVGSI